MIPYTQMTGPLFSIGPFHVMPWGFFVALGFLMGLALILFWGKRKNLDADHIYGIALFMLLGGIIGARLLWALTEAPSGLSFLGYLNIWSGGMDWTGGFIGGFLAVWGYLKWKKLDVLKYLDVLALGLPLGMAIGRVGCYLIGDHLGKGTVFPWAILLYGQLTHPIALYEIILDLAILALIINLNKKNLKEGMLFSIFVMSYSFGRFFIDFFRVDPTYFGLTVAQYFCLAFLIIFGFIIWKIGKQKVYKR